MLMTSQDGFAFPELGPDLVCEPRADIPADYSKPQVVALPEPAHIRNVPPGDTTPEGFVVIADGQRWQKQSSVTPFGVAYFYQRV